MPEFGRKRAALEIGRAQGRPGARRPHGPRAAEKARGRTTGAAEITRPSLRDGFNAYTRSPRGPAFLPPSSARSSMNGANLASAPGCQDHTISPSAPCRSSACENTLRPVASIASHPACRDDRDTPSCRGGTSGMKQLIWGRSQEFLRKSEIWMGIRRATVKSAHGRDVTWRPDKCPVTGAPKGIGFFNFWRANRFFDLDQNH